MRVTREDVTFSSHGATLQGWLYRPNRNHTERASRAPGVVMAHGFTAVREMFLDNYAAAFAAAGLVTLVYDHYGFGASAGEPRQYPAASIQLDGYRDAIAWLRTQPGVAAENIGIWGTSNSGGHVIVLACHASLPRALTGGIASKARLAFESEAGPRGRAVHPAAGSAPERPPRTAPMRIAIAYPMTTGRNFRRAL